MAEILIGDYGLIVSTSREAEVTIPVAGGEVPEGTWVEVSGKSGMANSPWADLDLGDIYYEPNAAGMAAGLLQDDAYYPLTENVIGFARSWQAELARNPIDTTALKDLQSTNIYGRSNFTGTIGGFLVTDDAQIDEITRRFVETIKIDGSLANTVVTKLEINTDPLSFIGYTLKKEANKDFIEAYWLPSIDLGTLTVGSEVGGLTDFSTPITLAPDDLGRTFKRYEIKLR